MNIGKLRVKRRNRRKKRIRRHLLGTAQKPRMSVYRSRQHIYVQLIDDLQGSTLVQASTRDKDLRGTVGYGGNRDAAAVVGKAVAQGAKDRGIEQVAFDRNGFLFHGRLKALAEAARETGLKL